MENISAGVQSTSSSLPRQVTAGDAMAGYPNGVDAGDAYITIGGHSGASATSGAVTTEQLALIGVTARLGATVTNEDAEDTATREEARLLLSLLGKKYGGDVCSSPGGNRARLCSDDTDDGSFSASGGGGRSSSPEQMDGFSLSCPSLSIEPTRKGHAAARPYASPIPQAVREAAEDAAAALLSPAQLFRRPLTVSGGNKQRGANDIATTAEAIATNVMRSFGAAAEWRGRAWMQSLGHVLSLREKSAAQGRGERLMGEFEAETPASGGHSSRSSSSASRHSMHSATSSEADNSSEEGHGFSKNIEAENFQGEEEEEPSNELKVIFALARSVSRIQIKSVQTSFRVQAGKLQAPEENGAAAFVPAPVAARGNEEHFVHFAPELPKKSGSCSGTPPPKKRRFRQVSSSAMNAPPNIEGRRIPTINGKYNVQHRAQFEAVLRVALPQENGLQQEQEVILTAPGTVRGTFCAAPKEEGSRAPSPEQGAEVLCGVEVKLDTGVLALSVERFSRMIVRKAAEADMLACAAEFAAEEAAAKQQAQEEPHEYEGTQQGHQSSSEGENTYPYHEDPHFAQYYGTAAPATAESSAYPQSAVVTPKLYAAGAYASPPGSNSSSGEISDELAMPLAQAEGGGPPHPQHHQPHHHQENPHSSNYLYTPCLEGTQGGLLSAGGAAPFVSLSPAATGATALDAGADDPPYAPAPEEHGGGGSCKRSSGNPDGSSFRLPAPRPGEGGTSLPALVEVACAAMNQG